MKFWPAFVLASLCGYLAEAGECEMTDRRRYEECINYCAYKYGLEEPTQRMYYNRFTKMCERRVSCPDTPHRVY